MINCTIECNLYQPNNIYNPNVIYFDQQTDSVWSVCWSKNTFFCFFLFPAFLYQQSSQTKLIDTLAHSMLDKAQLSLFSLIFVQPFKSLNSWVFKVFLTIPFFLLSSTYSLHKCTVWLAKGLYSTYAQVKIYNTWIIYWKIGNFVCTALNNNTTFLNRHCYQPVSKKPEQVAVRSKVLNKHLVFF